MDISETARTIIVTYVRDRLDTDTPLLPADRIPGLKRPRKGAVHDALEEVSAWCAAYGLPDIASSIIDPEQAAHFVMLPEQDTIDRLGGEAMVRLEQGRVRDYDWQGWLDS